MLGFLFGFNARLGRLHYFLATIGLAIVTTSLCFALAAQVYQSAQRGTPLSFSQASWPVLAIGAIFMLATLTLQSMRIRDIGWDPVCVIPTWIAIMIVDGLVACKFPVFSLGQEHHGTAVGGLINLGMMLALLFWPSGDYVATPPSLDASPWQPDRPSRGGGENMTASRIARVTNGEFGRR